MSDSESPLHRLHRALSPQRGLRARVRKRVMTRIAAPQALTNLRPALAPGRGLQKQVWQRIARSIAVPQEALLDRMRGILAPPPEVRQFIAQRVLSRLAPAQQPAIGYGWLKWVASVAVVALLIELSPAVFMAPRTAAESSVLLIPTQGEVAISLGGMWQEVRDEVVLEPGMRVRTYDGQASILFRDDAVARLDEDTILAVHDTSERLESAPELVPTFSLIEGRMWLQGFVPAAVRGITVALSFGNVTVHEGSVSLSSAEDTNAVRVWDRRALVTHHGKEAVLTVGEQTQLRQDNVLLTKKIPATEFDTEWPKQNLARDAVHRRYIAHLQHERLVSLAGILPTSNFYKVKRVAEEVDVLFTFNDEERLLKRLQQADTRLNEAAALLVQGEAVDQVADSLEQYRGSVMDIVSGSGGDAVSHFLIKRSLAEKTAKVAASLPGDESYVLKKAVFELTADLPEEIVDADEATITLFVDSLDALIASLEAEETVSLQEAWMELQPSLALIEQEESPLAPAVRKEARSLLERFATVVDEYESLSTALTPEVHEDIIAYLPEEPVELVAVMNDSEVRQVVLAMLERVYAYSMPQSRSNQLRVELLAIANHNERGRLLRALHFALPDRSRLSDAVRREIVKVRWQKAAETVQQAPVEVTGV